ncbi:hypothetical protein HBI24_134630 [Parastagonospora nodorum]|nr:hypothetical protein HBH54_014240 [Parastagonospora nodorum]KAH4006535.1 hypothetical protein HBI10_014110 [Parastagonospora nodorum]KAH4025641.1 hypothetical protein HBI13_068030 [Parastagonospora nodorum]KAH4074653.1 hypothetical protein HBH50_028190 [Parastagonospora nodorum]KAH4096713.1 hypothetical protein HBH48_037070 [Parastagonospora nodorum]
MASTTSNKHPLLLAAAVAHGVLALGHTTKGLDQFKHPSLNTLPTALRGAVQAGWYEGSVFFAIMGIMNYKWSMTGIYDIYDKSIATLLISLLIGAGASYFKSGDKPTATTLAVVAIIQGLGVRNGWISSRELFDEFSLASCRSSVRFMFLFGLQLVMYDSFSAHRK